LMGHNISQSYPMISDENPVVGYALIWTFYHKICQYKTLPNSIFMLMMVLPTDEGSRHGKRLEAKWGLQGLEVISPQGSPCIFGHL